MVTWPTDFPGLVIDPYRQCVVNQVELARFPVRVCECFSECTNPGAPLPLVVECFIYGEQLGDMEKGCPIISDGALGVMLGTLEAHFFARLQVDPDVDLLQSGGTTADTALRFNLYLAKPVALYEVYLVDDTGRRAYISFAPSIGSVLWVSIPLADFTELDGGFNWNAVRYFYFGFVHNYQPATCSMAIDNLRVCYNASPGAIGGLTFEPDSPPYGGDNPGDTTVVVENFDDESVLERVVCDAQEPGPPSPEVCDECVIGPPLTNGNQATHFCVDDIPAPPDDYPPSIRYAPAASFAITTDVTFTIYSWRPGVGVKLIMVDSTGRRAFYSFTAVGGAQTLTVPIASFSEPDGAFSWSGVVEWWTIFGTTGFNSDDRFGLDELKTNGGATLINDMSTLADIYCGYDPEPTPTGGILTCEFTQRASIFNPPTVTKFDSLNWAGALSVGTVSQTCDDPNGYWDLGFDDAASANADVQFAFNFPAVPSNMWAREFFLTLFDEAGRELMIEISPPASPFSIGDNLITVPLNSSQVAQPTGESKGGFDPRRVMYWQVGFVGFTTAGVYPLDIHFEGFRFRYNAGLGPVVTKDFLFENYADQSAFEAAGGRSCYEDWRLVNITPAGTNFTFLCGGGVTVNTDGSFPPQNVGMDRGRESIDVVGQEIRAERFFNPPLAMPFGLTWNSFELKYRARPDPGAPAQMHLMVQQFDGATATYSFPNGTGTLDANGVRTFSISRASMNQPIGNTGNDVRLVRLVKEGITNQPRSGTQGDGSTIFSGDEVDLVGGALCFDFAPLAPFNGKAGSTTVTSAYKTNGSIGAMGGDDQPPQFDGHVHHQTSAPNSQAGHPPPQWTWAPPGGPDFTGWLMVNKLIEGQTGSMQFALQNAPVDLTAFPDPNDAIFIWACGETFGQPVQLYTIQGVQIVIHDNSGGYITVPMSIRWRGFIPTADTRMRADNQWWGLGFDLSSGTPGPSWDPTNAMWVDFVGTAGWYASKTWFARMDIGNLTARTILVEWGRANWPLLMGFTNPSNAFSVGKSLDPNVTPVVALNCDRTMGISYWGMAEDWIRSSDIVLVPAKYRDDPIVGINGNLGYDEDGNPLPGVLEALARDTRAWYGNIAFKAPPFAGCRNIWMDLCYIDEVVCLGEDLTKALYDFWDTSCPCWGPQQEISNLVTHPWMDRILPDDQFIVEVGAQPLPSGYPEAAYFEYCATPDLDQEVVDDTDPAFTFKRETPTCSRPDDPINGIFGHYVVRVTFTAKQAAISINWTDVLPPGETLVQGVMTDPAIVLVNVGDTAVREYMLRTAQLQGGSVAITGAAVVVPNPVVTLVSPAISMDVDCDTLSWHQFGTQNPNVYGVVYWAGGGRPDPVVPAGVNLWTKVWAGPGSAGLSKREQYLFADATLPKLPVPPNNEFTFQLGGTGVEGFAVGLPVWVFNTDFVDNPARSITGLDIEAEEAKADPNEEVTGLYGEVTAINPALMTITVKFPVWPNQQVRFTMLAKACVMVAPDQSRGYYWEASPALVDVCKMIPYADQSPHTVIRWGYRYWNSTRNPAPGTNGAGYICDGDGASYLYELHGEAVREIINPVDWMDLLCSPVHEVKLANDAIPFQDDVRVCDICLFDPCDIIQIVDEDCTGKEGSGPGYVGSVVSTLPDDPTKPCGPETGGYYASIGHVRILPGILSASPGCGVVDGFFTAKRARAFVKPDVARYAYSPTTKVLTDGTPIDGDNFVGVNFETGTFTFMPDVVVNNPCACFRTLNSTIVLPKTEQGSLIPGIYFLKGIDKSGCKSPPSKPIKVVGPAGEEPDDCGEGRSPTLLFHKAVNNPETEYPLPAPAYQPVVGATFNFSLSLPSRVEFRVSLFGWDVVLGSVGGKDVPGWTELWLKDEVSGLYYPLADRFIKVVVTGDPTGEGDGGAGSVCSRVVDLPARIHVFNLYVRNGNPPSIGRIRFPVDIQVWRFGRCEPGPL